MSGRHEICSSIVKTTMCNQFIRFNQWNDMRAYVLNNGYGFIFMHACIAAFTKHQNDQQNVGINVMGNI